MIQPHTPDDDQLTDEGIRSIRESLITRFRHRVINRDDLESLADFAIAQSIARYDPCRVPNSRMGACVAYLADMRLRDLLRPEYRWSQMWKCENFYTEARRDNGHAEVAVRDLISKFAPRDRAIIKMRMDGFTLKEIGKAIGVTGQRIKQHVDRIRVSIRQRMPREVAAWQRKSNGKV